MPDAPKRGTGPGGRSAGDGDTGRAGEGRGGASWKVPLVLGAALLLIAAVITLGRSGQDTGTEQDRAAAPDTAGAPSEPTGADGEAPDSAAAAGTEAPMARRQPDDPTALGEVDAPVVMVVYSDYHCPYCGRWVEETQPELMHYVDSGDLRIEWRDFPIITDTSEAVALASRAAAAQGAFWEFHEAYYAIDEGSDRRDPEAAVARIVDDLGLDPERFDEDRNGAAAAELVGRDFSEGLSIGVTSTPAFLINGQAVMGAQPLEVFETVIDDSLEAVAAQAGGGGR